jgi:hypothetical protein
MDRKEISCKDVEWIRFAKDRVQRWNFVNTVMELRVL